MKSLWLKLLFGVTLLDSAASVPQIVICSGNHTVRASPAMEDIYGTTVSQMADSMILTYFQGNGTQVREIIRPHVHRQLQLQRRSGIQRLLEAGDITSQELKDEVLQIVSNAVESAMLEQRLQSEVAIRHAQDEIPTMKVAIISAVASIVSAGIGAGVALAIALTS